MLAYTSATELNLQSWTFKKKIFPTESCVIKQVVTPKLCSDCLCVCSSHRLVYKLESGSESAKKCLKEKCVGLPIFQVTESGSEMNNEGNVRSFSTWSLQGQFIQMKGKNDFASYLVGIRTVHPTLTKKEPRQTKLWLDRDHMTHSSRPCAHACAPPVILCTLSRGPLFQKKRRCQAASDISSKWAHHFW